MWQGFNTQDISGMNLGSLESKAVKARTSIVQDRRDQWTSRWRHHEVDTSNKKEKNTPNNFIPGLEVTVKSNKENLIKTPTPCSCWAVHMPCKTQLKAVDVINSSSAIGIKGFWRRLATTSKWATIAMIHTDEDQSTGFPEKVNKGLG